MGELIIILGLVGLAGGVIAVLALFAQRDANREKEKTAKAGEGEPRDLKDAVKSAKPRSQPAPPQGGNGKADRA